MSTVQCDLLIENGLVIDPANGINQVHFNVAVKDGKILDVFEPDANICIYEAKEKYDASGCYVMPGLIDVHVHCYEHVTSLGINPDDACLARGVTTIVDAGSAGW
jgi:dihydroorotase